MNGSPVAALVRGWVSLYIRGLPADARTARRDEIDDDLWCEHAEAAGLGRSARSLDADLFLRLLFGMPADVSWRLTHRRAPTPPTLVSSSRNSDPASVRTHSTTRRSSERCCRSTKPCRSTRATIPLAAVELRLRTSAIRPIGCGPLRRSR